MKDIVTLKGTHRFELRKAIEVPRLLEEMSTQAAPLNPEPADAQSRKQTGLEPKSFAAAAQQEPSPSAALSEPEKPDGKANGISNGVNRSSKGNGNINGVHHTGGDLKHSVLRITDTGVGGNGAAEAPESQVSKTPEKEEFEAAVRISSATTN